MDIGPVGRITAEGKSVVEVNAALTDDDLAWLNQHASGNVRYERATVADSRPSPWAEVQV